MPATWTLIRVCTQRTRSSPPLPYFFLGEGCLSTVWRCCISPAENRSRIGASACVLLNRRKCSPRWPRVRELRIVQEVFIGERFQECFEVTALLKSERESRYKGGLIWILAAIARVWALQDNAATVDVVVEDVVKATETAVMHIRRTHGYIAHRGRAEFAHVRGVVGELINAEVIRGIGEFPGQVVKTVVLKFNGMPIVRCLIDGFAAKGEPSMASGAAQRRMEEEVFATFSRYGDGILFMPVAVMVVRRVAGDESPLKGSQGLANMDEGIWTGVTREGSGKEPAVSRIGGNRLEKSIVLLD